MEYVHAKSCGNPLICSQVIREYRQMNEDTEVTYVYTIR
jgi:hypothetical protein